MEPAVVTIEQSQVAMGIKPVHYISINGDDSLDIDGSIVDETLACISVNGQEMATFMSTPNQLAEMALGFLYNEGVINGLDEVRSWHVSKNKTCVDIWLHQMDYQPPQRQIVTSGCGGGVTFDDLSGFHASLQSGLTASPAQLAGLMKLMHQGATLYQEARGIHTAVLAENDQVLLQVEDVGRHNCLDKLCGAALLASIATRDRIILSSGRISSEMINKARRLEAPIVCSRTSPTSLSVALAEAWNITIVAYLRQERMRVYTHPKRLGLAS